MTTNQGTFSRTVEASEYAFGRNAPLAARFMLHEMAWTPGCGTAGDTAGSALDAKTVTVRVRVSPVLQAGRISAVGYLSPNDVSSATTYTVALDGANYTATALSTAQAIIESLATDINAAASTPRDSRATAVAWGTDNGFDEGTYALVVWNEGNYTNPFAPIVPALDVNFTASGGLGSWTAAYQDAESIDFDVYEKHDGAPGAPFPEPWGVVVGGSVLGQDKPWSQKFNLAGSSRVAVQVTSAVDRADLGAAVTTTAWAWISPATTEEV